MSRSKYANSTLAGLLDSDSDETKYVEAMPTPDSGVENKPAARKGVAGKPKATTGKVTKVKVPARRVSGRVATAKKAMRPPLTDKTNKQHVISDTEEVEEFDQQNTVLEDAQSDDELGSPEGVTEKERKPRAIKVKPAAVKSTKSEKGQSKRKNQSIDEDMPEVTRRGSRMDGGSKKPTSRPVPDEIYETQEGDMDIADHGDEDIEQPIIKPLARYKAIDRSASQLRQTSVPRRRAGSASDTERNDPALRRKLGEMTNKFENLDMKYRNLREVGLKEAEHNFERLKKLAEDKEAISKKLILSLKADLTSQKVQENESRNLKKIIETQVSEIETLKSQVTQLTSLLSESQAQNKTLSTKLSANRIAASSVESATSKSSGSAMKANGGIRMMGSVEAAQQVQAGQLKEDLFGDLTGLIIRSVKREAEEDVYDCIQTGRNGTLHFKLAAANEKSTESFEETQCTYMPMLDPSRDKALIELLPDYLVDEIMFPRQQAARFYSRISDALTKRPEN